MDRNEIDFYLHNILRKQLQKFKISNYGLYAILDNIKNQLSSIIKNWNNQDLINSIFLTVIEEGKFYEPITDDKIGNLIVLGIRNSLLEIIASIDYKDYGLKKVISNQDIKYITVNAINYFKNIDLNKLSSNIVLENDYYLNVQIKKPKENLKLLKINHILLQKLVYAKTIPKIL